MSTQLAASPALAGRHSLRNLVTRWVEVEQQVVAQYQAEVDPSMGLYRWQPSGVPGDLPCITNWLLRSPYTVLDTGRGRDSVVVVARVLHQYSPGDEAGYDPLAVQPWEAAADIFRAVVDPLMWTPVNRNPFLGTAYKATRTDMYMESIDTGGAPLRSVSFTLQFDVDRTLRQEA